MNTYNVECIPKPIEPKEASPRPQQALFIEYSLNLKRAPEQGGLHKEIVQFLKSSDGKALMPWSCRLTRKPIGTAVWMSLIT